MLRIGMLTSGGDCQALNATMRAIYKSVSHNAKEPFEFYGFEDGYKGLMYNKYRMLTADDFTGILTVGARFWEPAGCLSRTSASRMNRAMTKWS